MQNKFPFKQKIIEFIKIKNMNNLRLDRLHQGLIL